MATNIAPSGTVTLTLNGTVSSDGALALTLADSYHRPYALETLSYTVDTTPPVSVTLAVSYVIPGSNTVFGFAQDDSPISLFESGSRRRAHPCAVGGGRRAINAPWMPALRPRAPSST